MIEDYPAFATRLEELATRCASETTGDGICRLLAEIDRLVEAHLAAVPREPVACRAGCPACCVIQVAVLSPETAAIAAYLEKSLDPTALSAWTARLGELADRLRWVDEEERLRLQIPCPFLDARGYCSIHPVRPLMCRSITSTDPGQCRRALTACDPDEAEPVTMNLVQRFLYVEAFTTLGAALARQGADSRSRELVHAVHSALTSPK